MSAFASRVYLCTHGAMILSGTPRTITTPRILSLRLIVHPVPPPLTVVLRSQLLASSEGQASPSRPQPTQQALPCFITKKIRGRVLLVDSSGARTPAPRLPALTAVWREGRAQSMTTKTSLARRHPLSGATGMGPPPCTGLARLALVRPILPCGDSMHLELMAPMTWMMERPRLQRTARTVPSQSRRLGATGVGWVSARPGACAVAKRKWIVQNMALNETGSRICIRVSV